MDDKDILITKMRSNGVGIKPIARKLKMSPAAIRKRIQKMGIRGELVEGYQGGTFSDTTPSREGEPQKESDYSPVVSRNVEDSIGEPILVQKAITVPGAKQPSFCAPLEIANQYPVIFEPFIKDGEFSEDDCFEYPVLSKEWNEQLLTHIKDLYDRTQGDKEALLELSEIADDCIEETIIAARDNHLVASGLVFWAYAVWDHLTGETA